MQRPLIDENAREEQTRWPLQAFIPAFSLETKEDVFFSLPLLWPWCIYTSCLTRTGRPCVYSYWPRSLDIYSLLTVIAPTLLEVLNLSADVKTSMIGRPSDHYWKAFRSLLEGLPIIDNPNKPRNRSSLSLQLYGQSLWLDTVPTNKLVPCAQLSRGTLEILSFWLRLRDMNFLNRQQLGPTFMPLNLWLQPTANPAQEDK